jgi:hypothetical protein
MNRTRKFLLISVGGLIALMLVGMVISVFTETSAEELSTLNLISEWKWYRMAMYAALVGCWPLISRWATRAGQGANGSESEEILGKRYADYLHMCSQWWKIVLLLIFIELVLIQQLGLGG